MTALVTGGSGFIGSHLIERLLERGQDVISFDHLTGHNLDPVRSHPRLRIVEGDIRDEDALAPLISPDVDVVYHLAAVVGVRNYIQDPVGVLDINVLGTRNVLRLAARDGVRVVLTSTSEVFGKNPKVPWDEDDDRVVGSTSVDRWSYSTSKALSEHLAFAMHRQVGLPITIVRYFNAYGPRQAPIYVVSQSVYKVLRGERPILYDGGEQTRCFTYVGDAVEGTIRAAEHPSAVGQAFNIGNSRESTMREALETIDRVAGTDLGWEDLDTRQHYGETYEDIPRRVPAVRKAKEILDWEATVQLEEGVRRTIEWARANAWWLA
jgi:dTDP-alpha-D-glucuronic acid decarboxylase